jgi:uncharacterized protein
MRFGALGDIHGDFEAVARIMRLHPEILAWLSVGDVGDDHGEYREAVAPLYWIKGNNEDFSLIDALAHGRVSMTNLHYLPNGTCARVGELSVAALGGTFAPHWYDTAPSALPYPGGSLAGPDGRAVRDDKRRHFVRAEVEACERMQGVDVLLTHEAPRPYVLESRRGPFDAGKTPLNEVLVAERPRLHLFGHHHRFTEAVRQQVRSIGLDLVSRSYLLIDSATMMYERLDT